MPCKDTACPYTTPYNDAILDKFSEHYQHQKNIKSNALLLLFLVQIRFKLNDHNGCGGCR